MQHNHNLQLTQQNANRQNENAAFKNYWESYNTNGTAPAKVVLVTVNGADKKATSYSDYFFDKWNLATFLNENSKYMLQFGAFNGAFLAQYQNNGWQVMGYDYSNQSIESLRARHIPAKQIDLNDINANKQLNYDKELTADLAQTSNIISVRILQYLTPEAICLLVSALMEKAQPNSVFFFVNSIKSEQNNNSADTHRLNRNYIKSFFSPRSDMLLLFSRAADDAGQQYKSGDHLDEVLVCKKQ